MIHELWNELLPLPDHEPSEEIVALLDRRMAEYQANPASASPWNEVTGAAASIASKVKELVVLSRAEGEIFEAYARLEDAKPGLGERFSENVERCLNRLASFPELGSMYRMPYRRILVPDSPFAVFYSLEGRRIIIQAMLDLRQDPESIRRRLMG